jgi:hypothetical protein
MSVTTIKSKVRNLIGDNLKTDKDIFTFTSSRIFSMSEERISDVTAVYINDVELAESGSNWTFSSTTNKVTIGGSVTLAVGDTIQIDFSAYENYTDAEILAYIQSAMSYISLYNYETFEYQDDDINPEPTEAEENLIAVIARIIIAPNNDSIKMPELQILKSLSAIPTEQMIAQAVASFKRNSHGIFGVIDNTRTLY